MKDKMFSIVSSLCFLFNLINLLLFFPQHTLLIILAILLPPIGLALSLMGALRGENVEIRNYAIMGNALMLLLLLFFFFALFTIGSSFLIGD